MTTITDFIGNLSAILWASVKLLFVISSNLNVYYLASSALVVGLFWLTRPAMRDRASSFIAYLLPARVFLHPSSLLDYKNYFVFMLLRAFYFGVMIVTGTAVASLVSELFTRLFGSAPFAAPMWLALAVITFVEFMLLELGYWVAHRLMHEIPLLWEFHKTHHAAEVMTPATAARVHPVDDILVGNASAVFGGFGLGLCTFLFGMDAHPLTLLEYNVVYYAYLLTFFHLRHSHIWIAFDGWLGHILHSPAHHQIHHSEAPRHAGKNLGYCLVCWDWAFGTLHVPTEQDRQSLSLGIGPEGAEYRTLSDLFLLPFWKAAMLFRPRRQIVHPAE